MTTHHSSQATWYEQRPHSLLATGDRYGSGRGFFGAGRGFFGANGLRLGRRYRLTSRSGRSLILTCRDREARGHSTIDLPRPEFERLFGRGAVIQGHLPVTWTPERSPHNKPFDFTRPAHATVRPQSSRSDRRRR